MESIEEHRTILLVNNPNRKNMGKAWQRSETNGDSPDIDKMFNEAVPSFVRQHWGKIRSALRMQSG